MTLCKIGLFVALLVLLQGAKCPNVPELNDINITVVNEEYIEFEFQARGEINAHSDIETIDVDDLRDELIDMDVEIDSLRAVVVSSMLYGVTAYNEPETDREIVNGECTVMRLDDSSSAVIFTGASEEVYPLLGDLITPPLQPGGIDFLQDLFDDVLVALKSGGPSEFQVQGEVSGNSIPSGRETNFDWRVRLYFQVSAPYETETIEF
jgi:hypothetical protein